MLYSQEEISKMKIVWGINLRRMLSEGAVVEDVKEEVEIEKVERRL